MLERLRMFAQCVKTHRCVACKKLLNEKLNALLDPMRERRSKYEANPSLIKEIVAEGTKKANEIGNENIRQIKEKMHVTM